MTEADLDSKESRAVCRQVSREAVVLLKNEDSFLPLAKEQAGELALIGGLAESDTVYRECLLREAAECMPGFTCVSPRQTAAVGAVMMGRAQL